MVDVVFEERLASEENQTMKRVEEEGDKATEAQATRAEELLDYQLHHIVVGSSGRLS